MDIYNFNTSNCIPLSANYALDNKLQLKKHVLFTENNMFFNLQDIFEKTNDVKVNNYSALYLSDLKKVNDILEVKSLQYLPDEGFTTYLAGNSLYGINNETRYWVTEEPSIDTVSANISVSGTTSDAIDNRFYFEILFLDNYTCKIAHEYKGIKRFLTLDYLLKLSFVEDKKLDYLGEHSPQIFLYVYDRANDLIVLLKNVNDIIYYLTFNNDNGNLFLTQTMSGTNLAFTKQTVLRCEPRQDSSNITPITDPWVAYKKDYNNNIDINKNTSFDNVEANYLVNTQYLNITSNALDVNVLSLKNTNTPENNQSRSNPFLQEKDVMMRDYKRIFSGSNQELGQDNIILNYESFTSDIVFPADKVTYFHIPPVLYPFKQINLNDTKLAESGAVAGDHPLKADKIFKKKADYKYYSFFGDSKMENQGNFLCSWLSGNSNFNSRPVWVDRYYFPSNITFIAALTTSNFNAIEYDTDFECIRGSLPSQQNVIDKLSDSIIEPGCYYAYHHIGSEYSLNYIQQFKDILVQKDLSKYYSTQNYLQELNDYNSPEYELNGNNYCVSDNLSAIQSSNEFTIMFDMYNEDWNRPFGYQILGNYNSDGFGLYNTNKVTPTIFIPNNNSIDVLNINFKKLNTVEITASATAIIRLEGLEDFFVITSDGYFCRFTKTGVPVYRKFNEFLLNIYDYDYDADNCYVLGYTPPLDGAMLLKINFNTGEITYLYQGNFNAVYYQVFGNLLYYARTVNKIGTNFYFTSGVKAERIDKKIYFRYGSANESDYSLYLWDTSFNTGLSSNITFILSGYNSMEDYDIDLQGNLWALYDHNKYIVIDSTKNVSLTGTLPLSSCISTNVDFGISIKDTGLEEFVLISALSSNNLSVTYKLNTQGELLDTYYATQSGRINTTITQSSYLRYNLPDLYNGGFLNTKIKLYNILNNSDFIYLNFNYPLSSLDHGYHHFALRFSTKHGSYHMLIDGKIVAQQYFTPYKYKFSNLIDRPFLFGTGSYSKSIPLFEYLQDNALNCKHSKLKNIYIYSQALNYFDIIFHNRVNLQTEDLIFDVPCGKRNYLEEIERYFNFKTPGSKSGVYNIVLKNSGINNSLLKNEIEKRIYQLVYSSAPVYSRINNIKWIN